MRISLKTAWLDLGNSRLNSVMHDTTRADLFPSKTVGRRHLLSHWNRKDVLDERADSRRRDNNQLYKVMIFSTLLRLYIAVKHVRSVVYFFFPIRHASLTRTADASSSDARCFWSVTQRQMKLYCSCVCSPRPIALLWLLKPRLATNEVLALSATLCPQYDWCCFS